MKYFFGDTTLGKEYVEKVKKEGATSLDLELWWSLPKEKREEIALRESSKVFSMLSMFEEKGLSMNQALDKTIKEIPLYGDVEETKYPDGPIPYELKHEVDKYITEHTLTGPILLQKEVAKYTSYNAFLRAVLFKTFELSIASQDDGGRGTNKSDPNSNINHDDEDTVIPIRMTDRNTDPLKNLFPEEPAEVPKQPETESDSKRLAVEIDTKDPNIIWILSGNKLRFRIQRVDNGTISISKMILTSNERLYTKGKVDLSNELAQKLSNIGLYFNYEENLTSETRLYMGTRSYHKREFYVIAIEKKTEGEFRPTYKQNVFIPITIFGDIKDALRNLLSKQGN